MSEVPTGATGSRFATLAKRARAAAERFGRTSDATALERAIAAWQQVLAEPQFAAKRLRTRLRALTDAGRAYRRRYLLRGAPADLDAAIACLGRAMNESAAGSRDRLVASDNFAAVLFDRGRRTGQPGDLDQALALWEDCLRDTPTGAKERPGRMHNAAGGLSERYDRSGDLADLQRAVALLDEAIAQAGESASFAHFNLLGGVLFKRFGHAGDRADLTRGLAAWETALARSKEGDAQFPIVLCNLAIGYAQRSRAAGDLHDLDRAIDCLRRANSLLHQNSPSRPLVLGNLSFALLQRYRSRGEATDVDDAVAAADQALAATPPGASGRGLVLRNLAHARMARFERGRDAADLDRAVAAFGEIVAALPPAHPEYPETALQLGLALLERLRISGRTDDVERAIATFEQVVAAARVGSPERRHGLNNLGLALRRRYERLLQRADLERAIDVLQEAVQWSPPRTADRAGALHNLGGALHSRYWLSGVAGDLDRAIGHMEDAVDTVPAGSAQASSSLSHLGTALRDRYLRTGRLADLERGLAAIEQAVAASRPDAADLPVMRGHLGLALMYAYEQSHERATLDRSVEALQAGASAVVDPTERAFLLGSLGCALSHAARLSGQRQDYDRSIFAFQLAIDCDPTSHNLPTYLGNLARGLYERYQATHDPAALAPAIAHIEHALRLAPASPIAPWFRLTLADLRRERFTHSQDDVDRAEAVQRYSQAAHETLASVATIGLRAARRWGDWAVERESWSEAAEAYGCGLEILSRLFRTQLSVDAKRAWLRAAEGLAARAAYALAVDGRALDAAVALERGRALLLAETLDRHGSDLERLRERGHDDLVDRYRAAETRWRESSRTDSALLGRATPADPFAELLAERWDALPSVAGAGAPATFEELQAAHEAFGAAIAAIRAVPGFEDFLALPGLAEIRTAAQHAPLVYLAATEGGGFAVVVREAPPSATVVWLPEATAGKLKILAVGSLGACAQWRAAPDDDAATRGWMAALNNVTGWLGSEMESVVKALDGAGQATLIPSGWFTLLPLHAAWVEDATAPTGRRHASDRIAWSYAPSARAVANGLVTASATAANSLLAVDEPTPTSGSALPNAAREVDGAARWFPAHARLRHGDATRAAVLEALPHYAAVHFACHADSNLGDPLASGLLMSNDQMLTVRDLIDRRISGARLAVLSACETAVPGVDLLDEQIGLPTCLLQAGFAGVVASLWAVEDRAAMLLMRRFYAGWRGAVLAPAEALRRAQQWVRDTTNAEKLASLTGTAGASDVDGVLVEALARRPPERRDFQHPFFWAAFIHVGA